ncbi:MAG: hypothetical protein AB1515_10860, partial [Nitrospirota bacterium]
KPGRAPREPIIFELESGPFRGRPIAARPRAATDGASGRLLTDRDNPIELLDAPAAEAMRLANRRYWGQ